MYLSESSKHALCKVLCNEIQVYKDLIKKAVNLNEVAIEETMQELKEVCPKEAAHKHGCWQPRPNFKKRIDYSKGESGG